MPTEIAATATEPAPTAPTVDRPAMPREYGMPDDADGLIAWDVVEARLRDANVYWIATSGPGGRPRVRPVDGIWIDGALWVGGSPETRWVRDLLANRQVSVHLDDGWDVAILEGIAELVQEGVADELAARLAAESNRKYPQYGMKPADYQRGPGPFAVRPSVGFAWKAFPRDLTRFRFG